MNHTYNTFLDRNLKELHRIYQEQSQICTSTGIVLVIQINPDKQIKVFTKPLHDLPKPIFNEYVAIVRRDESLLEKDRHVITCATQKTPYPVKEMGVLFMDDTAQYVLRGYQEVLAGDQYAFEFETFVSKGTCAGGDAHEVEEAQVNFKGEWMNRKTQTGQKYLQTCRRATADVEVFKNFRSTLEYQNIIIGGDGERGDLYYQLLQPNIPEYIKACDAVGNPPLNANGYSTYTLRCLYTMRDIVRHFGSLANKNIVEIGSGHGGLCHLISASAGGDGSFKSYTLVDLPKVNMLARQYLEAVSVERGVRYMSSEEIMPRKYDLVISEYCFSELDVKGQNYYLENIMKYCQGAYLAMNIWNNERKTETKARLMKYFNQIEEYPEEPESKYPNYKWICSKKKN